MKFSQRRLIEESQPDSLDMSDETVMQRHHGQRCKYQYPRHIRPHFSTFSKRHLTNTPIIIHQRPENQVCPIARESATTGVVSEVNQIHLKNVCRNLERRLKKAQLQGDEWLINLLEKEFQDLGELCMINS
ncbi:MAG: hypothetical protein QNJ64_14780 [Crocosphaera sp.]|nr:hypothetical protein [Crocosphaera sp.]